MVWGGEGKVGVLREGARLYAKQRQGRGRVGRGWKLLEEGEGKPQAERRLS